ncbi:MAG: NUDIX domain-containing protein [Patescibacteria group bacterium]|jgi:ADP-ribose pyrophosphatase
MKVGKDYIGVGCGAIIINDKNEVLLMKRAKDSRVDAGMWCRPGGKVEFDESAPEAVEREVKEETGLIIKVIRTLDFSEKISEDKTTHWVSLGFLAKLISGELKNVEPDKHDEIKWFPLNNLPNGLAENTKKSIDFYLTRAAGSHN